MDGWAKQALSNEYKWLTITFLKYSSSFVIREKNYIWDWEDSLLRKALASQIMDLSLTPTTQTQEKNVHSSSYL